MRLDLWNVSLRRWLRLLCGCRDRAALTSYSSSSSLFFFGGGYSLMRVLVAVPVRATEWVNDANDVYGVCVCVMCMQSVSAVGPRTQSIMMIENYGIRILLTALGRAHYRVCNVWMKRKRRKRGEKSTNNNNTHTFCIFLSMFASLRSCFLSVSVDELSIIIIIIIIDSLRTITAHQQATMPQPTQQQRTKTKLWNESSDFVWRTAERWQKNK